MRKDHHVIDPIGLNREESAAYVGVSPTLFDEMVAEARMPEPHEVNARVVWDREELRTAFKALPTRQRKMQPSAMEAGRLAQDTLNLKLARLSESSKNSSQRNANIWTGLEKVRVKGRCYYYWNPGRGTTRQGKRIRLPDPDKDRAAFHRELSRYSAARTPEFAAGSVGALVAQYTASEDLKKLSTSTQANYAVHSRHFTAAWGLLPARGVTAAIVMAMRDDKKETAPQANAMLSFGRTLWDWGIPQGFADVNPFEKVKDLDTPDRGHVPWPQFITDYICKHATPDLARLVRLGIMTCQRESDLIRMAPEQRTRGGIWCRPKKTKKRRRSFLIPLPLADALELDRWAATPIVFTNSRWKAPIQRHRDDLYLYSPRGKPYTETSLRARYQRWLQDTPEGIELCRQWQAWLTEQVRKYEWDITPEDVKNPTIHGLRGTGILLRYAAGNDIDQIGNDIGMSRQMVDRYMRFKDQMEVAQRGAASTATGPTTAPSSMPENASSATMTSARALALLTSQ